MKKILKIILPLVILGAILYQFQDVIRARFFPLLNAIIIELGIKSAPCAKPTPYTLGAFDARFNISQKYFLSALAEAEAIWEKPFGKELFDYVSTDSSKDILKVNLIYDYRQQATGKLASLGIVVSDTRASYDALKIKFTELKEEYAILKSDYDARVQSFNKEQKIYEEQVRYWNAQGGAPKKEYDRLQAEGELLNKEVSQLQTLQTKINKMVDEINAMVVVLNRLVGVLNLSVDTYNTIGASRGESFTEGVYTSDGLNREINIYEFSSRAKLVRVLAHELGHALELDHVNDAKAIMYEFNQGSGETLTKTDLDALKTKCEIK